MLGISLVVVVSLMTLCFPKVNSDLSNKKIEAIPVSEDDFRSLKKDLFSEFYLLSENYIKNMSLDEKIGQMLLVRYDESNKDDAINKYKVGGFVFYSDAFDGKTKDEVIKMISSLQDKTKTPLLTAVDEEGGSVVRVSSNSAIRSEKFKSPSELYKTGGLDLIKEDTIEKSKLLKDLGLNVNLAPVVDVSTNPDDYIYERTLKEDVSKVSLYSEAVVDASKGTNVSYVLKHFPGYGSNSDTHLGPSRDNRTLTELTNNSLPPFKSGIDADAEAILVSHNIVEGIDKDNPASLSSDVHYFLSDQLEFSGITMTDDLSMSSLSGIPNKYEKAVLAGNDILIVSNYEDAFNEIKKAVRDGRIKEEKVDEVVKKIIAWKYYKGLMYNTQK